MQEDKSDNTKESPEAYCSVFTVMISKSALLVQILQASTQSATGLLGCLLLCNSIFQNEIPGMLKGSISFKLFMGKDRFGKRAVHLME